MTMPGVPAATWQIHRAGLVDVNPIARMIAAHRPFIDLDGDGEPDQVLDPEHAGPATRLILSHGALEHGEVWFAREGDEVAAVAVWLPPDAEGLAADLHRVVARELGESTEPDPEPAHAPLRSIVGATAHTLDLMQAHGARRVLILLADAGSVPVDARGDLLADVLAPVIAAELGAGWDVLAVTVDPAQVADLVALGFDEVGQTPLGAASLWLGALRRTDVDTSAEGAEGQAAMATA